MFFQLSSVFDVRFNLNLNIMIRKNVKNYEFLGSYRHES